MAVPPEAGAKINLRSFPAPATVSGDGWQTMLNLPWRKRFVTDDYDLQAVKLDMDITAIAAAATVERD